MSRQTSINKKLTAFILVLIVEAIVLSILMACTSLFEKVSIDLANVPFSQIASFVKKLGNGSALLRGLSMAILAVLTFLPITYALSEFGGKKSIPEKVSLILLGVTLGGGTYLMVNPTHFLPEELWNSLRLANSLVSITIWSVIILCLALTGIRLLSSKNSRNLMRGFSALMVFIGILAVAFAVLSVGSLIKEEEALAESMKGIEYFVEFMRGLKIAVPYILDAVIAVLLFRLSLIYVSEEQSGLKKAAANVRRASCTLLAVTLLLSVIHNLLQMLFLKDISNVRVVTELPVLSSAFVVVAVLICNLIAENKELKDDNELFV